MRCKLLDAFGNTINEVKDLGWLRRNYAHITSIEVTAHPGPNWDCTLTARLDPITSPRAAFAYTTPFASKTVCWHWLIRPSLIGLPLIWFGHNLHISRDNEMPQ